MQTFLPFADFTASSLVLDDRRLGKQRVETFQILRALTWPDYAWKNHPAVRMWRGFVPALVAYGLATCAEWTQRGYADTVERSLLEFTGGRRPDPAQLGRSGQLPPWLGLPPLHLSHRSALVRKDPQHYRPLFGDVPDDLPYLWPPDAFPRWPVRRQRDDEVGVAAGMTALGYAEPRDGQLEAVHAAESGRDVLGCFAPGAGATSAGLLVGLARTGSTLWVTTHAGRGGAVPPEGLPLPEPTTRTPVTRNAGGSPAAGNGPAARPPSPLEQAAMLAEATADPHFRFHRPQDLADPDVRADLAPMPPATIVVDLGASAEHPEEEAVHVRRYRDELRRNGPVPLLVLGPAADAERRDLLRERYGLHEPVRVGGGFDPSAALLGIATDPDEARRRTTLARLIESAPGPGLVITPDRNTARRVAAALTRRAVRAAPGLLTSRRTELEQAVAGWRRGGIRALVLAADGLLPRQQLGRREVRFLHLLPPVSARGDSVPERREWLRLLELYGVGHGTSTAVSVLSVTGEVPAVFRGSCRRAALLDVVGEPVQVPCGRCDHCLDRRVDRLLAPEGPVTDTVSVTG